MRSRSTSRFITAGLVAAGCCLALIRTHAQDPRPSATIVRQSAPGAQLHQGTNCPGDMDLLNIRVINNIAFANNFITYVVSGVPSGVIGFSWSSAGPFESSLEVTVTVDAIGNGASPYFYMRAMDSGTAHVRACSGLVGCVDNPFDITVAGIRDIEFVEIDSPLDANPNPGGGRRIYPDRLQPHDNLDRRTVKVRASVGAPMGNVPVYFASFDVDDPSTDARPVDPNGSAGGDNNGNPAAGSLTGRTVLTNAAGIAETTLMVSMQPGDNFKVAASCKTGYLDNVRPEGVELVDGARIALPNDRAKVTEMLTVWRRLHVEVDSMGLVFGNQVKGIVLGASGKRSGSTTTIDLDLDAKLERQRFRGGLLTISGVGSFVIADNDANSVIVDAALDSAAVAGRTFVLVDDDDHNLDDGFLLGDGDEGEDVGKPDLSMLADSLDDGVCNGSSLNPFGAAYVCPVFDIGDDNDFVPFVLNAPRPPAVIATYDFDSIGTEQDPTFWTVYVLGGYQPESERDFDPGPERSTLGRVDDINGLGASIYLETIADGERTRGEFVLGCSNAFTVVHELGHLLNGVHPDGGIMSSPCETSAAFFSAKTIASIRKLIHP